jgi:hypothetical protein
MRLCVTLSRRKVGSRIKRKRAGPAGGFFLPHKNAPGTSNADDLYVDNWGDHQPYGKKSVIICGQSEAPVDNPKRRIQPHGH